MSVIPGSRVVTAAAVAALLVASPTAADARHLPHSDCTAFPNDNVWHARIDKLPVAKHSAQWVRGIGRSLHLHPDFGGPYGLPVTYVGGHHHRVRVRFRYSSESDHVRYPLGADTRIEGGSDRHVIVVDRSTCRLYETFDTRHTRHGWTAGSGATWSLTSNRLRPKTWTSADAAGLPILPGLLRYAEVKAGHVDHAIRFTAPTTARRFVWPARHEAGSTDSRAYPPMGARFRLKRSFPVHRYHEDTRVVLRAMKDYGLILADNGSPWFFQGATSRHWPDRLIAELKTIPAKAFQAVDESSLRVSPNSARAR